MFELISAAGPARRGKVVTDHGVFQTPAFMPVGTTSAVKALTCEDLEECGAEIIAVDSEHSAIYQCLVGENIN